MTFIALQPAAFATAAAAGQRQGAQRARSGWRASLLFRRL